MAASRSGNATTNSKTFGIPGAPDRTSFAKIREPLEVPNLLALQTASFDWLVGNETWQATLGANDPTISGLAEILDELSPIEDFSGSMSLSFSNPRFEDVKASIEECKDKDMTYAAPLFVTAEFTNNQTGEINRWQYQRLASTVHHIEMRTESYAYNDRGDWRRDRYWGR